MSDVLAIIPARGGSKGVPRKNVRLFAGRPLVSHSIDHALGASGVTRTVVSSDDPEIERVSLGAGAEVVRRPVAISGDTATSESALLHVLAHLREQEGYAPRLVVFLQATSPIRTSEDIDRAIQTLRREGADSLLSVCRAHEFLWSPGLHGATPLNYDPARRPRRQDMTPQYRENGSIYVCDGAGLVRTGCRLFGRVAVFEQDEYRSLQIDSEADWRVCEAAYAVAPGVGLRAGAAT